MPSQIGALYLAAEASAGTREEEAAADAAYCEGGDYRIIGTPPSRDAAITPFQAGIRPAKISSTHVEISGTTEVKAASAAGTAPEVGVILQAMGFEETLAAGTSATYESYSAPNAVANLYALSPTWEDVEDGNEYAGFGMRCGDFALSHRSGERVMLGWSGKAAYQALAAVGTPLVPLYDTGEPLVHLDDTTPGTIAGVACAAVSEIDLAIPITVSTRPANCAGADNGYNLWPAYVSRSGTPTLRVKMEMPAQGTWDWAAQFIAGTVSTTDTLKWTAGSLSLTVDFAETMIQSVTPEWGQDGTPNMLEVVLTVHRTTSAGYDIQMVWS